MCSRVLATIFIIYCLNTGFCEDLLDLSCTANSDCEIFRKPGQNDVMCSNGKCICSDIAGQQIKCKPVASKQNNIIGGPCPCRMEHSFCDPKDNVCLCEPDFIASYNRRRCVNKSVSLGERCEDNSQCIKKDHFSYCDLNKRICSCLEHFIELNGECLSAVSLDETCVDHAQCANRTKFSICSGSKCVCSLGLVAKALKSSCLLSVGYLEPCLETNQCRVKLGAGSKCFDYVCTCDSNHFLLNITTNGKEEIKCQMRAGFGDYCTQNKDCYRHDMGDANQTMECYLGECRCRKGFSHNDGLCQPSGSIKLRCGNLHVLLALFLPAIKYMLIHS